VINILTETEFHEDFYRCEECKSPTFKIEKHNVVSKKTHRVLDSEEYLVCTNCGLRVERKS